MAFIRKTEKRIYRYVVSLYDDDIQPVAVFKTKRDAESSLENLAKLWECNKKYLLISQVRYWSYAPKWEPDQPSR